MMSMQPTAVLNQRPFPRDRQGEKECVESGVIEAFADVAARRHYEPLRRIRNRRELVGRALPLLYGHPASQYDHMAHEATKTFSEVFQVILSFCEQDGRAALMDGGDDVLDDTAVSGVVIHQHPVDLLDAGSCARRNQAESAIAHDESVIKRPVRGLASGVHPEA
jgi:hypothetical protein